MPAPTIYHPHPTAETVPIVINCSTIFFPDASV